MHDPVAALATKLGADLLRAALLGVPRPMLSERYEIDRVLGRGASGVVVRVHDHRLMRVAAVKMALETSASGTMLVEARALAQLRRPPNVVQVHDVSVGDLVSASFTARVIYVAMEFVEGITLRTWLTTGARSSREILEKFAGAAAGLAHVHALGIVHGDFKTDNVMIEASGTPLLVDFGFAGRVRAETKGVTRDVVVGTGPYLAPEARRGRVRRRSDVYAFGISFWEAVTGALPFEGSEARLGLLGGMPTLRNEALVPQGLLGLLRRALHPNARRRPTMDELARAFRREATRAPRDARRRISARIVFFLLPILAGVACASPSARFHVRNVARRVVGDSDRALVLRLHPDQAGCADDATQILTIRMRVSARGNPACVVFGGDGDTGRDCRDAAWRWGGFSVTVETPDHSLLTLDVELDGTRGRNGDFTVRAPHLVCHGRVAIVRGGFDDQTR